MAKGAKGESSLDVVCDVGIQLDEKLVRCCVRRMVICVYRGEDSIFP